MIQETPKEAAFRVAHQERWGARYPEEEFNSERLQELISAAIRDAYERAAQLAELDGASDACLLAIRKLKGEK